MKIIGEIFNGFNKNIKTKRIKKSVNVNKDFFPFMQIITASKSNNPAKNRMGKSGIIE